MIREIYHILEPAIALEPQVINSDTTTAGEIIDTKGCDGGLLFALSIAYTLGDVTPLIEESDDSGMSGATEVPDAQLVGVGETGQEAAAKLSTALKVSSLGVLPTKRYIQLSLVSANSCNVVAQATVLKKVELSPFS